MKKALIAIFVIAVIGVICHAGDKFCVIDKTPQAKEPIGAVVETTGVFFGKVVSAAEIAFTGERKITVENETGECRIFPFCATTKIADKTFDAATFEKLKGKEVKVEYAEEGGAPTAKSVTIEE